MNCRKVFRRGLDLMLQINKLLFFKPGELHYIFESTRDTCWLALIQYLRLMQHLCNLAPISS